MAFDAGELPKPVTEDELLRQLRRARELIQQHGWTRLELGSLEEGFCTVGALRRAEYEVNTGGVSAEHYAQKHLPRGGFLARRHFHIMVWNDRLPAHTGQKRVLKYLDELVKSREKELKKCARSSPF